SPDAITATESGAELLPLDELLARSDFVSCHTPLTKNTRHFFGYERFTRMKPTAFFLNLSRGEVVDEAGLIAALREKRIAGAALDVRETEPPPRTDLAEMENVILTPHIAAFTREAQERVVTAVCNDVAAVLENRAAKNFANFASPRRAG
ncbi:MAG TPA: NAD(P)-dependent oxidoreductase, partial [Verrucomicrobiae bacterium]|nr:NAD(P)-dependent oxidoreductase [Verrucomicrobiae bacterium]